MRSRSCADAAWLAFDVPATPRSTACETNSTSSRVIDVRTYGARGDGRKDDTAAIQSAINAIAGTGGTVIEPGRVYMIDAAKEP